MTIISIQNSRFLALTLLIAALDSNRICIAAKNINIAWLTKEQQADLTPERIKFHARDRVERALANAYAKEHPLADMNKYQEYYKKEESCTNRDIIAKKIAFKIADERVNKLTIDELKDYYKKIQENYKHSRRPKYLLTIFTWFGNELEDGNFPPFSQSPLLLANIKRVLLATWQRVEEDEILAGGRFDNDKGLRQHPKYKEAIAACEKEYSASQTTTPTFNAFNSMLRHQSSEKVKTMTDEQIKEYYEKNPADFQGYPYEDETTKKQTPLDQLDLDVHLRMHMTTPIANKLRRDLLQKLANEYTIKSDSPEVLEAVREIKAGYEGIVNRSRVVARMMEPENEKEMSKSRQNFLEMQQ